VLIAPTDHVVDYHAHMLKKKLAPLGTEIEVFNSTVRGRGRERLQQRLRRSEPLLVIGTPPLLNVPIRRAGLIVLDEGHRISLINRAPILKWGFVPPILITTALPLPSLLLASLYGDLPWSIVREAAPFNRAPTTKVVVPENRSTIEQAVRRSLQEGQQLLYIMPSAGKDDKAAAERLTDMARRLGQEVFPNRHSGALHPRLKSAERDEILRLFRAGRLQILVSRPDIILATGVSPTLTSMIIEDAGALRPLQIHELRGLLSGEDRVSLCILVPSGGAGEEDIKALQHLEVVHDGFQLADEEFKARPPESYLGVRQAGLNRLWAADLKTNGEELFNARYEAFRWVDGAPESNDDEANRLILEAATKRWPGLLPRKDAAIKAQSAG